MTSRSGSASMRITVSEVWNGTPDSRDDPRHGRPDAGGDHDPVGGERHVGALDVQLARAR